MTGFSAEWLALREPVDHASVNAALRAKVAAHFAHLSPLRITDLGSGSGSSLRGLAPHFPERQFWRLIDYDPGLLEHARAGLIAWADSANADGDCLDLRRGGKHLSVEFVQADLARGLPEGIADGAHLVTSSAFFDLVSRQWIAQFAAALQRLHLPLYAMLTYDGVEIWRPAHHADAAMLASFHTDQHRDKGFGPAAGPDAAAALAQALRSHRFEVLEADSPWTLGASQSPLIGALADGSARAVAAGGTVPAADRESWRASRIRATSCTVGHRDLFAVPDTSTVRG
ncbi:MAG: SAM-dependent methyltransferase [Hyphomicrobiales bacterium]|nr:SAM-dependent methyltransferase [Hyphomicrobiales bacterium]